MNINHFKFNKNLIVMGNQAADLDSTVSAVSMAALLSQINPSLQIRPLIQGHRDDLKLKPEIEALFRRAGIPLDDSFFSESKGENQNDPLILVDHNEPDNSQISHSIAGIVDHHDDRGLYPDLPLREVKRAGSCATLISSFWNDSGFSIPYSQRLILAGAIAVDTGYLNPLWGKTTMLDSREFHDLSAALLEQDRAFLNTLVDIKNDLSSLTLSEHLKRDFKIFPLSDHKGGIASITMDSEKLFRKQFYKHQSVIDFCGKYCPEFLLIMHTVNHPFRRELSLYVPRSPQRKQIRAQLTAALEDLPDAGIMVKEPRLNADWDSFTQLNPTVSRKVLVPLLQKELIRHQGPLNC